MIEDQRLKYLWNSMPVNHYVKKTELRKISLYKYKSFYIKRRLKFEMSWKLKFRCSKREDRIYCRMVCKKVVLRCIYI